MISRLLICSRQSCLSFSINAFEKKSKSSHEKINFQYLWADLFCLMLAAKLAFLFYSGSLGSIAILHKVSTQWKLKNKWKYPEVSKSLYNNEQTVSYIQYSVQRQKCGYWDWLFNVDGSSFTMLHNSLLSCMIWLTCLRNLSVKWW